MSNNGPTFELARFAWGAPDRLELSGRFTGLPDVPADEPMLVINGVDGVHRLPVVSDSLSGPPEDGGRWDAVFAWQEAPVAFEGAKLAFGSDIVVELPEPSSRRPRSRKQTLKVAQEHGDSGPKPRRADDPPREAAGPGDGVQRLRMQADLLATQETLRELRSELQRTQEELTRARDDLASERQVRRADTERFHQGLAEMRDAATQALTDHQSAEQQVDAELRDARKLIATREQALEKLRGQLEAAVATRAQAESEAGAEIAALRERLAGLEHAGAEADQLRAELDNARSAMKAARSDAEQLLGRLSQSGDGG